MGAIRMVAGTDIRRHWRGTVVATLLIGLVGAIVMATAAGARRSDSALARFNAYSRSSNLQLNVVRGTDAQMEAFKRTPGVGTVGVLQAAAVQLRTQNPVLQNLATAVELDPTIGTAVDRPRVVAGRRANPDAVDEVNVGESLAALMHVG